MQFTPENLELDTQNAVLVFSPTEMTLYVPEPDVDENDMVDVKPHVLLAMALANMFRNNNDRIKDIVMDLVKEMEGKSNEHGA